MSDAAAATGSGKAAGSRQKSRVPPGIAIDGPAAAGKTTVGQQVGCHLGYPFLDTGAIYRAMTWTALHRGEDLSDEDALSELAASIRIDIGPPAPDSIEPCTIFVDGEGGTGA